MLRALYQRRRQSMRKYILPLVCSAGVLGGTTGALAGNGQPFNPNGQGVMTIAVYGDAPYGTSPTDTSETLATPAFIANINADPDVQLVMHVGDIHSGKQYCTAAY